MNVHNLLGNIHQVVALCIVHGLLAPRAPCPAVHLEDGLAIGKGNVEAVTSERQQLLSEHDGLSASGNEVVKDANWLSDGRELLSHCVFVCLWCVGSKCS